MGARILEDRPPLADGPLRAAIRQAQRSDEATCVAALLNEAAIGSRRACADPGAGTTAG